LLIFAVKTKPMFFQPRIGQHYQEGFKGYRTLVLGVKHHCILKQCPFYEDCVIQRNCASYDAKCPAYGDRYDLRLSLSNQIEIDAFLEEYDRYPTYSYFTKLMLGKTDDCTEAEKTAFWDQVAFANYLQYFCPSPQVPEYEEEGLTYRSEDWDAFQELLETVQPEVLLVWNSALKMLLDKKIADGEIKGLTHFDDFRSETLTINRYLYKVQPKKMPKELFDDFRLAFCLDDEATAARLMLNALQKARFRQFVPPEDLKLTPEMVEVAQPNIWDKELMSYLIGKLSAKQDFDKLIGAFEPQLKELAINFRCVSSFPLEIADSKAIDIGCELSELSWFDLGKVGSLEDTEVVILYLTDANDTLKVYLKALADNKLCRVVLLLDVKDSDKLLLDVVGCPNLSSIVEKGQALLLQFDGVVHEKVSLEHGKEKTYLRHKNLAKGQSLRPSDYLSTKMSKTELNNLVYSVFKDSTCVIATAKGDRDLVQLLEGLLDRDFVCRQGKRLKAVKGKAGQLLFYGLHRSGLSWNDLERLFADDNMAKNANADKIAKVLENDSAAVRYYKDLFGL
jgi:hypothetical protein